MSKEIGVCEYCDNVGIERIINIPVQPPDGGYGAKFMPDGIATDTVVLCDECAEDELIFCTKCGFLAWRCDAILYVNFESKKWEWHECY